MTHVKAAHYSAFAAAAVLLVLAASAQSESSAPPFDVAYRAWDVVTQLARRNDDRNISGICAKTFQSVAVPALRRQTRQEQDGAATACVAAARAACANSNLKTTAETARKCQEFR